MNYKIDINHISWVSSDVVKPLNNKVSDLKKANKTLKQLDQYICECGFEREMSFSYRNQEAILEEIKKDIEIIKMASSPTSGNAYGTTLSVENIVDLLIDQPFYKSMEKTVALLAKREITAYTVKNTDGISVLDEIWEPGPSINAPTTKRIVNKTPRKLNINDLLSTSLSKELREKRYQAYLKTQFPDLTQADIEGVDYKLFYDLYLKSEIDKSNFDYLTEVEEALAGLQKLGVGLGIASLVFVVSPGLAAALGVGTKVITTSSIVVNGFLSVKDMLLLKDKVDIRRYFR